MVSSKTTVVTARVPNEVARALREAAGSLDKSQSQIVTEALADWLQRRDKEDKS